MAAPRQQSQARSADSRSMRSLPPRERASEPKLRKKLLWLLGAAAVVAGVIVADDAWMLRDSLRRLAQGEEIPAFRAAEWANAQSIRESLSGSLLTSELTPSPEERRTRRNLALHTLVSAAGEAVISEGGEGMGALMEELCLDVDWLEEIVYFCPMAHAEKALPILAHLFTAEKRRLDGMPANRRLAAAIAFEFARAGLEPQQAREVFLFYASAGQKQGLNRYFPELSLWEMRVIASRFADAEWSRMEVLGWFQRNTRLPAAGYASLGNSLGTREQTLFGEPVESAAFSVLYRGSAEGGIASMYEASGCSTPLIRAQYAATAACANGVPALVVSGNSGAVCMVHVNGSWVVSGEPEEGMVSSWHFCGQEHPDFVRLASALGKDRDKTLAAARLAQMGQFFYDAGNRPLSHTCFREALKLSPQHYAALAAFRACGASGEEIAAAASHFEQLPGVAAALSAGNE